MLYPQQHRQQCWYHMAIVCQTVFRGGGGELGMHGLPPFTCTAAPHWTPLVCHDDGTPCPVSSSKEGANFVCNSVECTALWSSL